MKVEMAQQTILWQRQRWFKRRWRRRQCAAFYVSMSKWGFVYRNYTLELYVHVGTYKYIYMHQRSPISNGKKAQKLHKPNKIMKMLNRT